MQMPIRDKIGTIMSTESKDHTDKPADIKNAAALLLKGGSLISEACARCEGVQIRFKEDIICINCGNKKKISQTPTVTSQESIVIGKSEHTKIDLEPAEYIIQDKILMVTREIKGEKDLTIQMQKAELIETYLRILERIRQVSGGSS